MRPHVIFCLTLPALALMVGAATAAEIKVVTEYRYPTSYQVEPIVGFAGNGSQPIGAVVEPGDFETREVGTRMAAYAEVSLLINSFGQSQRVAQKRDRGYTELMIASTTGDTRAVARLLAGGADPNAVNGHGSTALMGAAAGGFADVVELLLDAGADSDRRSRRRYTALMFAARNGHADVVVLLCKRGAQKNYTAVTGRTALMQAIQNGYDETVQVLVENGADVHVRDLEGVNALALATDLNDRDTVVLLTRVGARK